MKKASVSNEKDNLVIGGTPIARVVLNTKIVPNFVAILKLGATRVYRSESITVLIASI